MRGRLIDLMIGRNGKQRITVEVDDDFGDAYDNLKDAELSIEIKKWRNKRSKNANDYFHVLVHKIAEAQGIGNEEVKKMLNLEYGTVDRDAAGFMVGLKLPATVDIDKIYPYAKVFDTREENDRLFNCYIVYKRTSELDSKEMSRLIDGAIYVAQGLDIETMTPDELAKFKDYYTAAERGSDQ